MWQTLGTFILRNRLPLLIIIGVFTVAASYEATKLKLAYDFAKTVPADDPDYKEYITFKQTFGEDGSVLVAGIQTDRLFEKDFFNQWIRLTANIKKIDGVENVLSLGNLFTLQKNDSLNTIELTSLVKGEYKTQAEVDSIKQIIENLPFYEGLLYNPKSNVTLLAITLNKQKLDSKDRIALVKEIETACNEFGEKQKVEMHYSGLPYVRTIFSSKVSKEIIVFTYLSMFITALFIFLFFRFLSAVIFSLIVVALSVVFTSASIPLFGFKVTMLTGILPPLMVIIGIQNCIYLLNVYHQEYRAHGNKMLAIIRLISKNGLPLFLTNVTTAVGFCVFSFSGSAMLDQFSVIAGVNIMLVYILSLVFIPIVYSYLPPPKTKHTKHLDNSSLNKTMQICSNLVYNHRTKIYIVTIVLCGLSVWGASKVRNLGYVVDDLPQHDKVYMDLKFFEKALKGVLPYEIKIDTKKEGGVKDYITLQKISKLQKELAEYPEFSKSISIADLLKYANQAYHDGDKRYYIVPSVLDINDIVEHLPKAKEGRTNMMKSMVDSTNQLARISIQMADIGSADMKPLNARVEKQVNELFPKDQYDVKLTGTSIIFLKGNDYLVENLLQSLVSALIIISLMMAFLFFSWKMVLISLIPNIVPLLLTLGIMGFFDIRLKPSTIIVFSIAYGIVVDFTIHFLAKYRNALKRNNWDMQKAIPQSINEAGPSIIYTAVALFFGFIIFAASSFGGTVALGVLTSISLLFGMLMNLLLLPSLLLSLEKSINNKEEFGKTLVELEPEPTDGD
jgi:hydrophobe/amphiphile efflux-3 (HAE3) family protein